MFVKPDSQATPSTRCTIGPSGKSWKAGKMRCKPRQCLPSASMHAHKSQLNLINRLVGTHNGLTSTAKAQIFLVAVSAAQCIVATAALPGRNLHPEPSRGIEVHGDVVAHLPRARCSSGRATTTVTTSCCHYCARSVAQLHGKGCALGMDAGWKR